MKPCSEDGAALNKKYVFRNDRPWKIAHRGASYYLPEHTIAAYRLAWDMRADYIEPDLVPSSDGVFFAIHSIDLNITTDVERVFGEDRLWYSPFLQRTSYWSFNFTAEELSKLRVRQRLPDQRSTEFDNIFGLPTLSDIVTNLHEWNRQRPGRATGLYAEIKDSEWVSKDTGMDVVKLFYDHIAGWLKQDLSPWKDLMYQGRKCTLNASASDKVPGLIIQSFHFGDLLRFHKLWEDDDLAPEPPYVLLVNDKQCVLDQFWFEVGQHMRTLLSGIGCAIACLDQVAVRERLRQNNLIAHPWTVRPEDLPTRFATVQNQVDYLMCNTSGVVRGIFLETPEVQLPRYSDCPSSKPVTHVSPGQEENSSAVIAASFILGAAITALLLTLKSLLVRPKTRRERVPTSDISIPSLELT